VDGNRAVGGAAAVTVFVLGPKELRGDAWVLWP